VHNLIFQDNATEFRVKIIGRFAGAAIARVRRLWRTVVKEGDRRFVIDISQMADYDSAGSSLLHDMFRYGVTIAAATPKSLVFLGEISRVPGKRERGILVHRRPVSALS